MNIGLIVDGQAEFRSLPVLLSRINTPHTILNPIYADLQPLAPVSQIAGTVKRKILILRNRNVHRVLVLLDLENRPECPGQWASQIEAALAQTCGNMGMPFTVVIKNSCYENWLVSDPSVFTSYPRRFSISQNMAKRIRPNKADAVDAQELMRRITQSSTYDKINDAIRVMQRANPIEMALNSRSFRRFLRTVSHPKYRNQSIKP